MSIYRQRITNKINMIFGTGDICIESCINRDTRYPHGVLRFSNYINPTGELGLIKGEHTPTETPVEMHFNNIASIDVVINSLQAIKEKMNDSSEN